MGMDTYLKALDLLKPEICLTVAILITALWNLFYPKASSWTRHFSLFGLAGAFALLLPQLMVDSEKIFGGLFTVDKLTVTFGLLVCAVGFVVVLMTMGYEQYLGRNTGEFYSILLTAVLSVMLLAGSTDLIMLFVALETLSICCVLLAGFAKRDIKSGEASLKYLLSTAAVTATLLYGLSFLYGMSGGNTTFDGIANTVNFVQTGQSGIFKFFVMALILSVIGFKLSTVPFHMWTPDVYEGAPTPVTAFLSIGSKAGGFAIAARLLLTVFGSATADWSMLVAALAILSMIIGNLIALTQTSFKRMLAYSSIAHVGYILIGLIAANHEGLAAMTFYIIVYGFMNLGAFAGAILFSNETGSDRIESYAGLVRKRPILALCMAFCLLNLAGLPIPPAGFFAKVFVFSAGLHLDAVAIGRIPLGWLLVSAGLITSIPAIYYYTRVVIMMFVPEPSDKVKAMPEVAPGVTTNQGGPSLALWLCAAAVILFGTTSVNPVMSISRQAMAPLAPQANPISYLPPEDKN